MAATTKTIDKTASHWALAGDVCHYLTIGSTLSFAFLAGSFMRDPSFPLFDSQWRQEGFCVTNRDVPFWNSHDVCLYVDTALALGVGLMYLAWRKDPGMEQANIILQTGIPGILLHGIGHGGLGKAIRDGTADLGEAQKTLMETTREKNETPQQFLISLLPLIAFWFFLSKASMPQVPNVYIALAAGLAFARQLWLPGYFGFTYVQTILMLQFSANQLCRPRKEKDLSYFLYPAIVGLPLTLVGWMESTMCSTVVRDFLYGHVAYDAYIPLAMMVWYTIVHHTNQKGTNTKVKQV